MCAAVNPATAAWWLAASHLSPFLAAGLAAASPLASTLDMPPCYIAVQPSAEQHSCALLGGADGHLDSFRAEDVGEDGENRRPRFGIRRILGDGHERAQPLLEIGDAADFVAKLDAARLLKPVREHVDLVGEVLDWVLCERQRVHRLLCRMFNGELVGALLESLHWLVGSVLSDARVCVFLWVVGRVGASTAQSQSGHAAIREIESPAHLVHLLVGSVLSNWRVCVLL